jgi:hypothetical protein
MKKIIIMILIVFNFSCLFSKEIRLKIIDKELDIPLEGVKVLISNSENFLTDADGNVTIKVDDKIIQQTVVTYLPGYEQKKIIIKEFDKEILVSMVLAGVLEGEELVIEGKKTGKTDDKSGQSNVIDKEQLKSTANIGIVEDVMTSIKTLPGVGFTNGWGVLPSIRGGDPNELTAVYDGFIVRYPFHWGGAFSIFNPNIVESAKLSNGVYSAKYGLAISGLLEVTSKKADDNVFKINFVASSTTSELFLQIPMTKKSGLLIGGRLTYYSLIIMAMKDYLASQGVEYSIPPYICDAYLKWFFKPDDRFEWYINGFFGSDGIGMKGSNEYEVDENGKTTNVKKDIKSIFDFKWYNYDAIVTTGFKILPNDKVFIHILTGYNFHSSGPDAQISQEGTKQYTSLFINTYHPAGTGFTVPKSTGWFKNTTIMHDVQGRIDTDISLHEKVMMSFGGGMIFDYFDHTESGSFYQVVRGVGLPAYEKVSFNIDSSNKKLLSSFLYLNFNFIPMPNVLSIELGMRIDHAFLIGKDMTLNTYPVPNPRFYISYTPVRNLKYLDYLTLSLGTGLFSKMPDSDFIADKKYGIKDFQIGATKALTNVLGMELGFPMDFRIKIEGYYKFYFDRVYVNNILNSDNSYTLAVNGDGIGHVGGFDIMLERKISRYVDGWISYSFVYERLLNPTTNGVSGNVNSNGEPTGEGNWYYPSYHRMHNLSVVINIRPVPWMTITPKLSFATGTPMKKKESTQMYPAINQDNNDVMELYSSNYVYDDNLRNGFSIPLDLRLGFNYYFPKSKVQMEAYIAVENLFAAVYSPAGATQVDQYSGKEIKGTEANFSIPIPMPSLGIKLNF